MNWKNVAERALWTFLEGFLVALPAAAGLGVDAAAWKAALLGALMAGLSAVKTLAIELLQAKN